MKTLLLAAIMLTASVSLAGIPNFHDVTDGISRGGRPNAADVEKLARDGVRTIINLENEMQVVKAEERQAKALGINFISSPMSWSVSPTDQQVDKILEIMSDPKNYPLFVHCKHGRDRTGMVVGLYRVLEQGWTAKKAYNEMLKLGFRPQLIALDSYFKERAGY